MWYDVILHHDKFYISIIINNRCMKLNLNNIPDTILHSKEQEILVDIAIYIDDHSDEEFTIKTLCENINISRHNPILCKVVKQLVEKNIFETTGSLGTLKYYKAYRKRIRDYVDELPFILKINEEYNRRYHIQPY